MNEDFERDRPDRTDTPGYAASPAYDAPRVVVGSFADQDAAEAAIDQLRDAGYDREQIGFARRDEQGDRLLVEEHGNAAGPGALGGVVTGAAAGGTLAWLGLTAIPAIGPFLAAGAIGTTLIGAGAGALGGGVLGGLLGLGIPRHKAEYHEEQLRQGRSLITVRTSEPEVAGRLLSNAGAIEVDLGEEDAQGVQPDEAEAMREEVLAADRERS